MINPEEFFVDEMLDGVEERKLAQECAFDLSRLALSHPEPAKRLARFIDHLFARLEKAEA